MFDNYDDILNVADVAKALKIGNTQAYKLVRSVNFQPLKWDAPGKSQAIVDSICPANTDL